MTIKGLDKAIKAAVCDYVNSNDGNNVNAAVMGILFYNAKTYGDIMSYDSKSKEKEIE